MARREIGHVTKNRRERIVVYLSHYRGARLVELRLHTDYDLAGEFVPTQRGLSLRVERLPDLIAALELARAEAEQRPVVREAREAQCARGQPRGPAGVV